MERTTWQPSCDLETLKKRAKLLDNIRAFFKKRGYLEVETPILASHGVTDVYLDNLEVQFQNKTYYLQTSPEYHMKRLLAAGSGPIFQLSKVFRDDEVGRWHNPEFTLLEWYQLGVDHHALLNEVDLFLQALLDTPPLKRMKYEEAFLEYCGIHPFESSLQDLRHALTSFELQAVIPREESDRDQYLFLLMAEVVEPKLALLDSPVALYDFPASQASLARLQGEVAERFEVYYQGLELANGFHELLDPTLQTQRFQQDLEKRSQKALKQRSPDPYFLAALQQGLPPCSGVALGIDRFISLALKKPKLSEVLSFDISNA